MSNSENKSDIKVVRLDSLDKRIPMIEKMAVLEIKIAELEKKLAVT